MVTTILFTHGRDTYAIKSISKFAVSIGEVANLLVHGEDNSVLEENLIGPFQSVQFGDLRNALPKRQYKIRKPNERAIGQRSSTARSFWGERPSLKI